MHACSLGVVRRSGVNTGLHTLGSSHVDENHQLVSYLGMGSTNADRMLHTACNPKKICPLRLTNW